VKRGAIVVVAARGAYTGNSRPALVVQSDLFNPSVPRSAIDAEIGRCDAAELEAAEDALRRWLGFD
jgi:mRNA-degrading endonuclease toxin of MazEF toxin-antitoxin module